MLAKVYSAAVFGVDAYQVEVEVDLSGGLPSYTVVGLPDTAVRESRERVAAASLLAASVSVWVHRIPVARLRPAHPGEEAKA